MQLRAAVLKANVAVARWDRRREVKELKRQIVNDQRAMQLSSGTQPHRLKLTIHVSLGSSIVKIDSNPFKD